MASSPRAALAAAEESVGLAILIDEAQTLADDDLTPTAPLWQLVAKRTGNTSPTFMPTGLEILETLESL